MGGSLDTNVLLRLVLDDVPEQSVAVEKLLLKNKKYEIADAALFEMVFVLEKVYRLHREQIAKSILTIVRNNQFNCNRKIFELTMPLYVQETKLSIIDCALSHYATLQNANPLYTFDQDLAKKVENSSLVV